MPRSVSERADLLPVLGEVFREHGYAGASLRVIGARTGLGKGSLYHFFPGGKDEMAEAVLDHVDAWFEREVFEPLRERDDAEAAIAAMFNAVDAYFRSGRRVCLVGAFALGSARDRFARRIDAYFQRWIDALAGALRRTGEPAARARSAAEDAVIVVQGALVAARALDDERVFTRALRRVRARLPPPRRP